MGGAEPRLVRFCLAKALRAYTSHLVCGGVYDQSTGLLYKGGRYFDPLLGIWLALLPLIVVRRKKKRRGYSWIVVLALCLGGMSGVLTACGPGGGEQIDWEEIKETVCVEIPPNEFKTSQNVDIHHVSGPNATIHGGFDWNVRFELEEKTKEKGWIIQKITRYLEAEYNDGVVVKLGPDSPSSLDMRPYYEAFGPVKVDDITCPGCKDIYENPTVKNENVVRGKRTTHGIVMFYVMDELPPDFVQFSSMHPSRGGVPEAGSRLYSSYTQPPYWNGCGTTHDIEINWDGQSTWGHIQRGNQRHTWGQPPSP